MKTKMTVMAGLMALMALTVLPGCATAPGGTNTPTAAPTVSPQMEQALVTAAATGATVAVLNKNPKLAPDFTAGAAVLNTIAGNPNTVTVAEVDAALTAAGATNSTVNALIPVVVNFVDVYAQSAGPSTNAQVQAAQQVCGWAAAGITAGVAATGVTGN